MKGFTMNKWQKEFFYVTQHERMCKTVVDAFINKLCDIKQLPDEERQKCLSNELLRADIARQINKADLKLVDTGKVRYYSINGKYFTSNIDIDDVYIF